MAFEESKHPRDKNGQFTSKGGGSSIGSSLNKTNDTELNSEEKEFVDSFKSLVHGNNEKENKKESPNTKKQNQKHDSSAILDFSQKQKVRRYAQRYAESPDTIYDAIEERFNEYRNKGYKGSLDKAIEDVLDELVENQGLITEKIENDDAWENWEEWDNYDAGKTHGYATIDDYNRANEILDELDTINKKWKNDDRELLKTWQNKSLTDEEYNTKNDELYKKTNEKKATLIKELDEITTRADKFKKQYNEKKKAKDEKERKQAYKLFDLDF